MFDLINAINYFLQVQMSPGHMFNLINVINYFLQVLSVLCVQSLFHLMI